MVDVPWVMVGCSLVGRMPACESGNEEGLIPRLHWMDIQMLSGDFAFFPEPLDLSLAKTLTVVEDLTVSYLHLVAPTARY